MQQHTSSATTSTSSWPAILTSAAQKVGGSAWGGIWLTFFGWFGLDTLRVAWGPLKEDVHFYDLADVIGHPTRLFTGLDGARGSVTVLFMLLCSVTLLGPMAPYIWRHRYAWLAWIAPLALMLVIGLLLSARTSGDIFRANGLADTLGNDARHLASHLFRGAGAAVAQKVTFGAGSYLALFSSIYLALRGIRGLRDAHRQLDRTIRV